MTKEIFAEGLSFWKLFLFIVIGCLFGTYFEELLYSFQNKTFSCRVGVIYGPFNHLYGFGVVLFLILLGKNNKERGILKTFFYASFIGGITEYIVSYFCELFFQFRFWDYSNMTFNIHGRTTIPFMFAWSFFSTILLKVIYPFVSKWIERIPRKIGVVLSSIFLFFLFVK